VSELVEDGYINGGYICDHAKGEFSPLYRVKRTFPFQDVPCLMTIAQSSLEAMMMKVF
jgi:hypothetical protein